MENGHIERTFTLAGGAVPTIVARNPNGLIHIQGEERNDVAVTVTVEPASALGRDLEILVEQHGETIVTEARGHNSVGSVFGWLRGNTRVTMEIRTPTRSNAEADAASASVQIEGLDGATRVRTASGDVRADRLTRDVTIQTASGDVRTYALTGTIRVQSASGDVALERGEGDVSITTASGDIMLDRITGTLEAGTASGDLSVRSSALLSCRAKTASGDLQIATPLSSSGDYDFSTVSGDLALLVPEQTRATVAMKTVSGDLSCALPATSDGGKRNRTLAINGGGVAVRVKSVSGDCTIRATNDLPPLPTARPHAVAMSEPSRPPMPPMPPAPPAPFHTGTPAPDNAPENDFSETLAVLQAVERGELTIDEAMEKLASLEDRAPGAATEHGGNAIA